MQHVAMRKEDWQAILAGIGIERRALLVVLGCVMASSITASLWLESHIVDTSCGLLY
jgi:hypothetical protein